MKRTQMLSMIQDEITRQLDELRQQIQNIRNVVKGIPGKNDNSTDVRPQDPD